MSEPRIADLPRSPDRVRFREGFGQRFVLTVDTEEEFDWAAPLDRNSHRLDSVGRLAKFQEFCANNGVVPVYLVDYPIATSPIASEILRTAVAAGKAEVGVHFHPWVTPPHAEEVNQLNSFAGNLPPELEREKFRRLYQTIEQNIGTTPVIYRAGRYGVGPHTAAMLGDFGIAVDSSVRSRFDYSSAGGPNFRDHPLHPYWVDRSGSLLEMPLTTVYWGPLRSLGPWLYPRLWRTPWLRGALARSGLMERIPFTPEGVGLDEIVRGIDIALDDGLPLLVFAFHSPSLAPGHTPYVRNEAELDRFYDWWREVFAYLARRQVAPTCVAEIMDAVELG